MLRIKTNQPKSAFLKHTFYVKKIRATIFPGPFWKNNKQKNIQLSALSPSYTLDL